MSQVPSHTQIPNEFIDESMARLTHAQFKVLIAICRKTIGWQKKSDYISISQIMDLAGVSNKTVVNALSQLEDMGYITTKKSKHATTHITINYDSTSVTSTQGSVMSTQVSSVMSTHTKEITKENIYMYKRFVTLWNETYGTDLRITDKKRGQIKARLKTFSDEEIERSIKNRANDEWINNEGKKYRGNWDSFWRNDDKIERYLNGSEGSDSWQSKGFTQAVL
jgi:phage replication O-like protein O